LFAFHQAERHAAGDPAHGGQDFHAREIGFDSRFHAYPVAETIHIGAGRGPLVFQAAYDEGFSVATSSTDFNTNTTTFGYDALARPTLAVKPYNTTAFPTTDYDYALAVPAEYWSARGLLRTGVVNYIETRQLDREPGAPGNKRDH